MSNSMAGKVLGDPLHDLQVGVVVYHPVFEFIDGLE